ncbi:hypothetical protein TNCV_2356901 [Trichonephila clavipes]|nr:hypothetical protein TNCV_2356901 [Trichonephila clavipes]
MCVLSNEFEWNVSCSVNLITSQSGVSDEEMLWRDSSTEMKELKTFLWLLLAIIGCLAWDLVMSFDLTKLVDVVLLRPSTVCGCLRHTLICPEACPTDDQGARLTEVKRSRDPILGPCGHITHSPAWYRPGE